jgi:hypothetical protein
MEARYSISQCGDLQMHTVSQEASVGGARKALQEPYTRSFPNWLDDRTRDRHHPVIDPQR